jgi:hypothetical protein
MKPTSVCNSRNNSDGTTTQMPLICSFHVFPTTLVEKTRLWEWSSILEPWRKLLKYFVCHTIQWLITTAHRCTSWLHTHAYIKELYDLFLDTSSLVHIILLQFDSEVDLNWRMEKKTCSVFCHESFIEKNRTFSNSEVNIVSSSCFMILCLRTAVCFDVDIVLMSLGWTEKLNRLGLWQVLKVFVQVRKWMPVENWTC